MSTRHVYCRCRLPQRESRLTLGMVAAAISMGIAIGIAIMAVITYLT